MTFRAYGIVSVLGVLSLSVVLCTMQASRALGQHGDVKRNQLKELIDRKEPLLESGMPGVLKAKIAGGFVLIPSEQVRSVMVLEDQWAWQAQFVLERDPLDDSNPVATVEISSDQCDRAKFDRIVQDLFQAHSSK